jgi:multiple antibiotic resistance protein
MNEAVGSILSMVAILAAVVVAIVVTYLMMIRSDMIMKKVGQREFRVINRIMGMLLIAIAVQFVVTGIKATFPLLAGG